MCRVFGRRIKPAAASNGTKRDCYDYWITDGLYGSMNCLLYDHATLSARTLRCPTLPPPPSSLEHAQASTVFGPTCDGLDVVLKVRDSMCFWNRRRTGCVASPGMARSHRVCILAIAAAEHAGCTT